MNSSRTSRWPTIAEPAPAALTPAPRRPLWPRRWSTASDASVMLQLSCTVRFRTKWPKHFTLGCLDATSAKRCALGTAMQSPTKSPYSIPEPGLNGRSTIGEALASPHLMQLLGSPQPRVPGWSAFSEMSSLRLDPKICLLNVDLYGLKDPVGASVVGYGHPMHLLGIPARIERGGHVVAGGALGCGGSGCPNFLTKWSPGGAAKHVEVDVVRVTGLVGHQLWRYDTRFLEVDGKSNRIGLRGLGAKLDPKGSDPRRRVKATVRIKKHLRGQRQFSGC